MNLEESVNKKRQTHNYTSELELKSLLIRIKNNRLKSGELCLKAAPVLANKENELINRLIKLHTEINSRLTKKIYSQEHHKRRTELRNNIKSLIVTLSEKTFADAPTYERFGEVALLMIKRVLTKPQFSGYSYKDDFYSDAVYKITKYLHNFDHTLISERTNQPVNAFAYISQYIHNSIVYIIKLKKRENDDIQGLVKSQNIARPNTFRGVDIATNYERVIEDEVNIVNISVTMNDIELSGLSDLIKRLTSSYHNEFISKNNPEGIHRLNIIYPSEYSITFDEYSKLGDVLNSRVSIIREIE